METHIFLGYEFFWCQFNHGLNKLLLTFNIFFMQPIKKHDLQKVDPLKACEYFSQCFRDPSAFTVVIVGNIDPAVALPLILQYLVSITLLTKSQLTLNNPISITIDIFPCRAEYQSPPNLLCILTAMS